MRGRHEKTEVGGAHEGRKMGMGGCLPFISSFSFMMMGGRGGCYQSMQTRTGPEMEFVVIIV